MHQINKKPINLKIFASSQVSSTPEQASCNFGADPNLLLSRFQSGFALLLIGCRFFAYNWKLPAYSGAFQLTIDNFSFVTYNWSFCAYNFSFFAYIWSFFAYSGKVHLISALRDCKQRSFTVSKKLQL